MPQLGRCLAPVLDNSGQKLDRIDDRQRVDLCPGGLKLCLAGFDFPTAAARRARPDEALRPWKVCAQARNCVRHARWRPLSGHPSLSSIQRQVLRLAREPSRVGFVSETVNADRR
jgi:hypothetical protein